jgi:hypothetical protein
MRSIPSLKLFIIATLVVPLLATATPRNSNIASPDPAKNPGSSIMLAGEGFPSDHQTIDFDHLPRLPVDHAIVSNVHAQKGVNQHNYLVFFDGKFWAMWSDGPRVEDMGGQVVKYSTSPDGLTWATPKFLTDYPTGTPPGSPHYNTRDKEGFRYISRGFWVREGQLLALASLDEAAGFFGPSLTLHAFRWNAKTEKWDDTGVVQKNAINNFPPHQMPSGEWAMTRRKWDYKTTGVEFLIGGVKAMDDWTSVPVVRGAGGDVALKAEEPMWWTLPNGNLAAFFRDNSVSHYIYRAFSTDNGRTWSAPVQTDFPDARSKLHGIRLTDGRYVLVSNSNPAKRDPMTIAVSADGLVFTKLFYIVGGRHIDYPQVMQHGDYLYVAHSGAKMSVEIERIRIADLDRPMTASAPH